MRSQRKLAVSDAPGASVRTRSSPPSWQSREEKTRSFPLKIWNSIWLVPTLTEHAALDELVTLRVSSGFFPAG